MTKAIKIIRNILVIIAITVGIIWVVWGIAMMVIADGICKNTCEKKGTFAYERYGSGNYKIDDICVCFIPNKGAEVFRLK